MKNIDLNAMRREELEQLIKDAEKALKTLDARQRTEARRAAEQVVKEYGLSLTEVLEMTGAKNGPKGAPKYANPADPSQTWTGRGRKPNWVNAALAQGKKLEDLAL